MSEQFDSAEAVFGWADKLSAEVQRVAKVRELRAQIVASENECGSCTKWMTSDCPKEVHSMKLGRYQGPSSRATKCAEFSMSAATAASTVAAKERLAALENPHV